MCDVPEHHAEKKREGHDIEQGRVYLLVPWNAVGVYDLLKHPGKFVSFEVRRQLGCLVRGHKLDRRLVFVSFCDVLDHQLDMLETLLWDEDFSVDEVIPDLALVEIVVNKLFLLEVLSVELVSRRLVGLKLKIFK